jgi:ribonuclease HII
MNRQLLDSHSEMELSLLAGGATLLAGVDEAGRGPLAGPVVAAAVIFSPGACIDGITDSKALSERRREELATRIREHALCWAVAEADVEEIDAINILRASLLAMRRAVEALQPSPRHILIDGNRTFPCETPTTAIVRGDTKCFTIAAASILAKTARDAIMRTLDKDFPQYGFAAHKGYATSSHIDALRRYGPCQHHRRSFTVRSLTSQTGIFDEFTGTGP